jgi:hypothetical protein
MIKPVFAIDVGGVLASKQHDGEPVENSLDIIPELANLYDLWIVSMCGTRRAEDTKLWLREWEFDRYIPVDHQIYIPFKDKNKNYQLDKIKAKYFIDDRIKHLRPAIQVPSIVKLFHFGDDRAEIYADMRKECFYESLTRKEPIEYIQITHWIEILTFLV